MTASLPSSGAARPSEATPLRITSATRNPCDAPLSDRNCAHSAAALDESLSSIMKDVQVQLMSDVSRELRREEGRNLGQCPACPARTRRMLIAFPLCLRVSQHAPAVCSTFLGVKRAQVVDDVSRGHAWAGSWCVCCRARDTETCDDRLDRWQSSREKLPYVPGMLTTYIIIQTRYLKVAARWQ